nr:reverse transcriptase domain-containing protein [Tanacetum cinerariifolium]
MRTRSSSNLLVESLPNLSTSNPKRRNRRRSKQPFILEESPIDTMADQQLLHAPTEGYAEAIVVPRFLLSNSSSSTVRNSRNKSVVSQVKSSDANSNSSSSEIAKLIHAFNQQTSVVTTSMTVILKQFQATSPPASVKAVEEICVTCGAAVNYNQGNSVYHPPGVANQIRPSGFAQSNVQNNQNRWSEGAQEWLGKRDDFGRERELGGVGGVSGYCSDEMGVHRKGCGWSEGAQEWLGKRDDFGRERELGVLCGSGSLPSNSIANPKGELKDIPTRSGIVLDGPFVPIPPPFINLEEDERVKETLTDQDLAEYTIKIPPPLLKCKALADLGASINLMPLSIWKKFGLPELISTRMTLKLANRAICTPARIARDVFVPVGKFKFPADFVIVDYESDPRVPRILGRSFLRIVRALIDVHGEKMILRDHDERLTLNMRHDTSRYSNQPQKESINMINIYDDLSEDFLKELFTKNIKIEPDQGKLTSVVMKDNLAELRVHVPNVLTNHPTLMLDSDFIPSDNSLPEYEIFYFDIEEKNSSSTTIHVDISLSDLESFNFDFKPDQGELTSIVDFGICENVLSATNVNLPPEEDHSPLVAYVVWIFLSFQYLVIPPRLFSFGNENTIFDPGIASYHFISLLSDVSHRCETFMKFNVYPKLLNESPMEILSSSCSLMEQ